MSVKPIHINVINKTQKPLKNSRPQPKIDPNVSSQLESFQSSMKYCYVIGQCLGLFPITNITGKVMKKLKYKRFSWPYLLSYIMVLAEVFLVILTFFQVLFTEFSLSAVRVATFFAMILMTSILFIRLSANWHHLMDLVVTSKLDEYVDLSLKFKCKFATIALLSITLFEHVISKTFNSLIIYNCHSGNESTIITYEKYLHVTYAYVFDLNPPYAVYIGILVQIFHLIASFIWSYSHLFIICISLYLTSIFELLNKKIVSYEDMELPELHWRALRENYNCATHLVHSFDEVINIIIFVVTATDLFFVCCQVYYFIGELLKTSSTPTCLYNPSGILIGYEYITYLTISVTFYVVRFFAVLLVAAKIHSASLVAAPSLYNVSSSSYCSEVQRFIEKIHSDTVALTGFQFFFTTRDMILSVIGTIITYELVLLQFRRT